MWFREMVRTTRDRDTDCLAITNASGTLIGVVTDEDLMLKLVRPWPQSRSSESESRARRAERRKAAGLTALELMSQPVVTVDPELPAVEAGRLMRQENVRHLLVVDQHRHPTGVVHRSDLLGLILRPDDEVCQDVEDLLARRFHTAEAVGVHVEDGVVVLEQKLDIPLLLEDIGPDVEEVEGVVAVRTAGAPADDRWEGRRDRTGYRT